MGSTAERPSEKPKPSKKQKRKSKKQKRPRVHFSERGGPIRLEHIPDHGEDQVLSVPEWAALNNFSLHTGARILAGPNPPVTTQLSENRIGITRKNNREWQASRERKHSA